MKKVLSSLFFAFIGITLVAQTIVSTSPENKNVILEEFTGIHCGYCPQGHAIAQSIQDANPNDVFLINIHQGGYATPGTGEPDFRTDFGDAIAGQSGLTGYPAGTVNRHIFPGHQQGSGTAQSRGSWSTTSNQILGEGSYVNVGVEAEIDVSNRELTVHVEVYYTENSPESTNLLNVAILQNNTLGPQSGGGAGDEYVHMHRLVHLITGQWGEDISTTTTGTFVDRTYNYTIPADYRDVPAELADIEIVAFVTETHQEVSSGYGCYPTYTGFTYSNDASVEEVILPDEACSPLHPSVIIRNEGGDDITSLEIEYSINGGSTQTYNWNGTITPLKTETIDLDEIVFTPTGTNTFNVSINSDENNSNNSNSANFDDAPEGTNVVNMELHTDAYGDECTWDVKNSSGTVLYSGGPYPNNQTFNEIFVFDLDCHTFNIYDSYGDGGGAITLEDSEGTVLYYTNGTYGSGESQQFSSASIAIGEVTFNPADGATDVDYETDIFVTFNQPMRNLDDTEITNADIPNFLTLSDLSKANISFTASINDEKTEITITPDTYLPELEDITVSVAENEIETTLGDALAAASATFTTAAYPEANVTFDPADGTNNVGVNKTITLTFDDAMRKSDDSEITDRDISTFVTLTDLSKGDIAYTGTINAGKTEITINPDESLPELTAITVTILGNEIENGYDKSLDESSATFTTKDVVGISELFAEINIYPNPAKNVVFISNAKNSTVTVTDMYGKSVLNHVVSFDSEEIDINNLTSGLYIVKIELNGYKSERKLIIVK